MRPRFIFVPVAAAATIPAVAAAVERLATLPPPTPVFAAIVRLNPVPPSITVRELVDALRPREVVIDVKTRPTSRHTRDPWMVLQLDERGVRSLSIRVSLGGWVHVRLVWGARDPASQGPEARSHGSEPNAVAR